MVQRSASSSQVKAGSKDERVVRDYKELIAYQKSYNLVLRIYRLTASFPRDKIYGLTSQIQLLQYQFHQI